MAFQAVLFDVGGTLLAPHPSVGEVYAEVADRHGVQAESDQLNQQFKNTWNDHRRKIGPTSKILWKSIVEEVFAKHSFSSFDTFFEDLFNEFQKPARWRLLVDIKLFSQIKNRSLQLGVASNWDHRLPALLKSLGLFDQFDHILFSAALGFPKSDPRFFAEVLKTFPYTPKEILHVGDDLLEDGESALSAGLQFYDASADPGLPGLLPFIEELS